MMKTLALCALAACTTPGSYDSTESAIIGGTRSTGTISTVMVVAYPTDLSTYYTCSGVVIAPTVVLTAAHCVDHPANFVFGIFTGDDATPYAASATTLAAHLEPVAETHIAPGYSTSSPFYGDLGVAITSAQLAITPAPVQRYSPGDLTGMPATIIGYGQTVFNTNNYARYTATTVAGAIEDDTIIIGDDTKHGCLGDSGGPAFVGGMVIGIDSYGPVNCTGASHYRRPDAFASFIETYVPTFHDDLHVGAEVLDLPPSEAGNGGGCCDAGSGPGGATLATLGVALVLVRRRRVTSSRA